MSDFDTRLKTWRDLQEFEERLYRESYEKRGDYYGYFSMDKRNDARTAGEYITAQCGNCLDIGSGILPRPAYMGNSMRFMGLDPFFGEHKREFPFVQAIGEYPPFQSASFECVSFMSALDHQIEPLVSLREAYRVLTKNGLLFLWVVLYSDNSRDYRRWRNLPPGTKLGEHHQHAFIEQDIRELLAQSGFEWLECTRISRTYLITGQKIGAKHG
ncbi:MAG: class I SAM-dependent methyltransferase [Gammaproteobacteria bacterium]|nr:class I SAM-dependent methyltransferase [Gammaproteobacteria bacterium]